MLSWDSRAICGLEEEIVDVRGDGCFQDTAPLWQEEKWPYVVGKRRERRKNKEESPVALAPKQPGRVDIASTPPRKLTKASG